MDGYFTIEQAADLAGLHPGAVRRWIKAGLARPALPSFFDFRGLVGLRVLAALKERGVSTKGLALANAYLLEHYPHPWSSLRFWVADGEVHFEPETGHRVDTSSSPGQAVITDAYVVVERVESDLAAKIRASRDRSALVGQVSPGRWNGRPQAFVAGTRVPTSAIGSFDRAGYSLDAICDEYPDLERADIEAAIAHERSAKRSA